MDYKFDFGDSDEGAPTIVYVRPAILEELPRELREQAAEVDDLYSVHDADGQRLALVRGRKLAFDLARQNDMLPVNVH